MLTQSPLCPPPLSTLISVLYYVIKSIYRGIYLRKYITIYNNGKFRLGTFYIIWIQQITIQGYCDVVLCHFILFYTERVIYDHDLQLCCSRPEILRNFSSLLRYFDIFQIKFYMQTFKKNISPTSIIVSKTLQCRTNWNKMGLSCAKPSSIQAR